MKQRNPGMDFLRLTAMFFVICQHILGQGGVLAGAEPGSGIGCWLRFLQSLVHCAVNVYGITTGFLLCRKAFRLRRIVKLWLTTVFWSVAVSCVCFLIFPQTRSLKEAISMFLPVLRGRYWFFNAYLVVILLSPVLNLVIRTLSQRQLGLLVGVLLVLFGVVPIGSLGNDVLRISGGHHFAYLGVLYLLGGWLRRQENWCPVRYPLACFFLLGGLHLGYQMVIRAVGLPQYEQLLLTYPSPLILGEALCLFWYFQRAKWGRLGSLAAPGVWAVYVIHAHPLLFWNETLRNLFRAWDGWRGWQITGALVVTAAGVLVVCLLLDWLRQQLFRGLGIDRPAERLSDRAEKMLRKLWKE